MSYIPRAGRQDITRECPFVIQAMDVPLSVVSREERESGRKSQVAIINERRVKCLICAVFDKIITRTEKQANLHKSH